MIEIKNINKSFNDKQVLFNISGKFDKGKTNLIIGASGTGNSVLLKCLVGLLEPDIGEVLFDKRDFTSGSKNLITEIRREIGMLFQGGALFDSKNVFDVSEFILFVFALVCFCASCFYRGSHQSKKLGVGTTTRIFFDISLAKTLISLN